MTTGKTIALTIQTFVDKVMPLLFNMLSRLAISLHMRRRIVKYLSRVRLSATPWTVARQAPLSVSPGKSTGVGCHFLLQGNLPHPRTEPRSPASQADSLPSEPPGKPLGRHIEGYEWMLRIPLTEPGGLYHAWGLRGSGLSD